MAPDLDRLLYLLFKGERSTVILGDSLGALSPIAQAAGRAIRAHHDLCECLDGLARLLIENNLADDAEVVCKNLDWPYERAELQGRLGEFWYRTGRIDRALICFDAAEGSAQDDERNDMRAGALADLAVRLVKVGETARATRVRNLAIDDAVAGQALAGSQTAVDSAKVLGHVATNLAEEGEFEEAERVALLIEFPHARERCLAICKQIRERGSRIGP